MTKKEELLIRILKNGEVEVDVIGSKGKGCEKYVEMFQTILGQTKDMQYKPEYYEQDPETHIDIQEQS